MSSVFDSDRTIQPLPSDVVRAIAAGEVIDSLAAVVRELAENAIDAGATRLVVSIDLDRWLVRVADNGCGMTPDNLRQAAIAHSTSKIHRFDDLHRITSLGFRGEALHSLANLARLEIHSRTVDGDGWCVRYDRTGKLTSIAPVAMAPGTIVSVRDLFCDWPGRREALPSPAQQWRAVQWTVQHLALCHPHVTWQVWKPGKRWFAISPGQTPRQILVQLLRGVLLSDLRYVRSRSGAEVPSEEGETADLELVLGAPHRCHRHRLDWLKFAINGRVVNLPDLEQTVLSATSRTLPRHRYPLCFVHLHVAPDEIDWNRHPAKTDVYLRHVEVWQQRLAAAIDRALRLDRNELAPTDSPQVRQLLNVAETKGQYRLDRAELPSEDRSSAPLVPLRAIGQVNNTYIVAEHPGGLWLVEQHIAHERVIYEQLQAQWELLELEPPIVLEHLTPLQIEQLQRLGIEVDPFGEGLWAIRQAPTPLARRDDCADALLELSGGADLEAAQVATACRSAIRNGTILTLREMQTLLDRWQQTRNPRTCPHGRPIYLALDESSLARYFRRHWVIGKSHGI
ncbi:MAG: DNA mismatch repair endonuclease MutL [Cyanobacteria bacterium SID2]|nr:DNA mismatch repair endonuclease MutL [Cyanobacteria bacterium SID2]MBP0004512.1 DNA mismatch repair endonuclease MutL [Cyanobacteria bacterium SBC]